MQKRILTIIFSIIVAASSCSREQYYQITGYAQGGTYFVKYSRADIPPQNLKDGIDSILVAIDNAVSGYNPSSLLSKLNNAQDTTGTQPSQRSILNELVCISDSIFSMTGGVVDSRAAALFDAWGFGFKDGKLPSDEAVAAAMNDRSKLNFNAIAQGYSCDKVAAYLRIHGVGNYLVNIGGEMACKGVNPSGAGWSIGIDSPVDGNMNPGKDMSGTFNLEPGADCGVVTSGNYRKFYVVDGVKYSHTIDPRTGHPVTHNLLSATIIAPSSATADAIATYCMVVGMDEARAFIEKSDSLQACLIASDTLWRSENFILNR